MSAHPTAKEFRPAPESCLRQVCARAAGRICPGRFSLIPFACGVAVGGWLMPAAFAAEPIPKPSALPAGADIVALSPFVVGGGDDEGYGATETLSGTRLRARVRDLAAPLSIINADFLRDIGATNYHDIADFLPSTASYANHEGDLFNNGSNTGTPTFIRGFRSNTQTVDFFASDTPVDSYNTGRITYNRGPNSILFGIGSAGGALNVDSNRAELKRNFGTVELRSASFDSSRATLDLNLAAVPNRFALRANLLDESRSQNNRPSHNDRRSVFLTATAVPAPRTILFVNAEASRIGMRLPHPYSTFDWYSPWFVAGRPMIAVAKDRTARTGIEFLANAGGGAIHIPGIGVMDWSQMGYGARPRVAGVVNAMVSFGSDSPHLVVPLDTYVVGLGEYSDVRSNSQTAVLQHQLAGGLFVEIGGKREHMFRDFFQALGQDDAIQVDPNARLPNGAPNPNAGLPYVELRNQNQVFSNDTHSFRMTVSYEKNLRATKVFGRGLGWFNVAALYSDVSAQMYLDNYRELNATPLPGYPALVANNANWLRRRSYLVPGSDYFKADYRPINEAGVRSEWLRVAVPRDNWTHTTSYALAGQANLLDELISISGGIRRDDASLAQREFARDARSIYVGSRRGTPGPRDRVSGDSHSIGTVLHLPWNLGVFFNRSTNFEPANRGVRFIDDTLMPPLEGRGFDAGLKFNLLNDRVVGSMLYFETSQLGVSDNSLRGSKFTWINQIWDAIDASKRPFDSWSDNLESKSRGIEFETIARPTKNIRLMANLSRNVNTLANHGAATFGYLARNYPIWLARASTPVISTNGANVGALVAQIQREEADDRAVIGKRTTRIFEWQANMVGRYRFDDSTVLKNFAVGGAFRWRSAPVIGFARDVGGNLALNRPFRGDVSTNVDTWIDYARRLELGGRRLKWSLQFRVQNLLDNRELQPWTAVDDGTGKAFIEQRRRPGQRTFVVSTNVGF